MHHYELYLTYYNCYFGYKSKTYTVGKFLVTPVGLTLITEMICT
ncbi:hypothetical protein FHS70_001641 [Flammeovirga yaeyamensis]|nr:hypothetical protein [Flammeovirga yaeyamensis]